MQILDRTMIQLFPSCLFVGKVSDITICDRLENAIREIKQSGRGRFSEVSYQTPDDISKLPQMKEFCDLVLREAKEVLDVLCVKRESHYISNMWANIAHPNHRHPMHIHPNCLVCGILYVRTPPNCGGTMFSDPRPGARMLEPSYSEMNRFNMGRFVMVPEKGTMVMWPSFLPHAVDRGTCPTEEDRITIAFNIMIRGTIDTNTAYLELK